MRSHPITLKSFSSIESKGVKNAEVIQWDQFGDTLRDAEIEADKALLAIRAQLTRSAAHIETMEAAAARAPDGRLAFRYANGRFVDQDNDELPAAISEGIIWPPNAPSAEDYFEAKERHEALENRLQDWGTYRNDVLGGIRDRYDDTENLMTKDEMKDMLERLDAARPTDVSLTTTSQQDATISSSPSTFPSFN